jgi:hypothetical protein
MAVMRPEVVNLSIGNSTLFGAVPFPSIVDAVAMGPSTVYSRMPETWGCPVRATFGDHHNCSRDVPFGVLVYRVGRTRQSWQKTPPFPPMFGNRCRGYPRSPPFA